MLARIPSLGSCLIGLMLLLFAGSAAAEDVSSGCAAAIDRAAGSYSRCLLGAQSRNARRADASRLEIAEQRCADRFDSATVRALDRAERRQETCTPYLSEIAERTVTCAEGVATEAGGKAAASRLYVQDAIGGTLTETTLVLSGIDESTPWFTERPYREAGQITTAEFVALFSEEGANSFAEDPPTADFTCKSGGKVVNQVVTLTDPVLDEAAVTLTYTAALVPTAGDDDSFAGITCDGDAYLFIDSTTAAASACTNQFARGAFSKWNCFVAGFCAEAAIHFPPNDSLPYKNVYDGISQEGDPFIEVTNCKTSPRDALWAAGQLSFQFYCLTYDPDIRFQALCVQSTLSDMCR